VPDYQLSDYHISNEQALAGFPAGSLPSCRFLAYAVTKRMISWDFWPQGAR
jgi:hypothetical protein